MVSKGKAVFRGLLCSTGYDVLRASIVKDICKTLGILYLDLETIISTIKERQLDLQMKEHFEEQEFFLLLKNLLYDDQIRS